MSGLCLPTHVHNQHQHKLCREWHVFKDVFVKIDPAASLEGEVLNGESCSTGKVEEGGRPSCAA